MLFVDDCTRFQWNFFMNNKSQATQIFLQFDAIINKQFNAKIKYLHNDGGTKFKALEYHLFQGVNLRRISYP